MKLNITISEAEFKIILIPENEFDLLCHSAIHEATRNPTTKIVIDTLGGGPKEKKSGDPAGR